MAAVCLLGLAAGCGSEGGRWPLSGTVTYRGKLLEQAVVTFHSTEPPGPVCGALVTDGSFTVPAAQGLEPGTYKVTISASAAGDARTPEEIAQGVSRYGRELLPPEYNDVAATRLTVEVRAGTPNHFDWNLE